MTLREYLNTDAILRALDRDELVALLDDTQWQAFRANPARTLRQLDDATAAAIWRAVELRERGPGPLPKQAPAPLAQRETDDRLFGLYRAWQTADAHCNALAMRNIAGLSEIERFDLDVQYREALVVQARAKNAYEDAVARRVQR